MWKKILIIGIICLMIIPSLSLANLDVLKIDDSNVCNSSIENSPSINIDKPKEGYLYITDEEAASTIFGNTVIIDRITVKVNIESENGISKVKFYVDDVVKSIDYDEPFEWVWDATIFGRHELKVKAYDDDGNNATDEMNVMIFNHRKNQPWPLTESNSRIRDIPTVHDFIPIGTVHMETKDHILKNLPDRKWGLQCFIFAGEGETEDGKHKLIVQARVPIEGGMRHRIYLDSQWYLLPATKAPMYFDDEKRIFPYPTVYTLGETPTSLSYDEQGRRWILKIENPEHGIVLEIEGKARGIPFWMGKPEGPYIIHGVSWSRRDVDTWGGFWDLGTFEANLTIPGGSATFYGNFLFDRAYHRSYYWPGGGSSIADFSCMHLHNEEFDLAFSHAINPSPIKTPVSFQHQARLNFPDRGEDFTFDNFEYSDNGGLQPSEFHISGTYEAGEVDLIGVAYNFWPENWGLGTGAWWDKNGKHTWGRAFIEWNGTITLHGETINIDDALGVGEFTRFEGEK